ncbi:UDP-glucosyltransferase 2 [Solenopsis invicta]|uniref:UDP-glucosyltransferase 2 n=1 Tax=Solenopsis invicta TaxID=13686 RepID=UPI00193DB8F1|nr:UDP-glucosyltransferase 2 [Solenopsis invicta]XP_039309138.1 UDP-glucosyltransferase 2 [Solenopsis invicta]
MRVLPVIFLWLHYLSVCNGYRLLGIFPLQSKSHFGMFEQLMKGLARKGHQVDIVSSFPLEKSYPNYTDLVTLPTTREVVNKLSYAEMKIFTTNPTYVIGTLGGNEVCKHLGNTKIKELAKQKNPSYDAIIVEVLAAQCFSIIAHILKIPMIGVTTRTLYPWVPQIIGQPENLAFVSNINLDFTTPMNFWQRLCNVLRTLYDKWFFDYLTTRVQDKLIRENFGPDMPSVREIERKLSLILVNSHITLDGIQPRTPAVVDVGGLHIHAENQTCCTQLQPELKKWMDDSKDGFIYFTFGSMVTIETFPHEFLRILYASLGKIAPVRVLIKVTAPEKLPSGLPENIHISPWMPQLMVLRHSNIKAFITHGGFMGTQEAISCGVPMIGIPLFMDQFTNINAYVVKNITIRLDINEITERSMDAALNAILKNPLYRESAQNLSRQFLDRPMNAIDTATYWIEYVIKYGENSLRSPAMDMTWWQLSLVDVILFLLFCATIIIAVIVFIVQFILKLKHKNSNTLYSKKFKAN